VVAGIRGYLTICSQHEHDWSFPICTLSTKHGWHACHSANQFPSCYVCRSCDFFQKRGFAVLLGSRCEATAHRLKSECARISQLPSDGWIAVEDMQRSLQGELGSVSGSNSSVAEVFFEALRFIIDALITRECNYRRRWRWRQLCVRIRWLARVQHRVASRCVVLQRRSRQRWLGEWLPAAWWSRALRERAASRQSTDTPCALQFRLELDWVDRFRGQRKAGLWKPCNRTCGFEPMHRRRRTFLQPEIFQYRWCYSPSLVFNLRALSFFEFRRYVKCWTGLTLRAVTQLSILQARTSRSKSKQSRTTWENASR